MKSGLNKQGYLAKIRNILVFRSFNENELEGILRYCEVISFEDGENIVTEGDISPSFFAIIEGAVKVTVNQDGKDVYICTLGGGDIFGEAAMFLKVKRTADVTATGPVIALKFIRHDLFDFLKAFPRAGNKFLMLIIYGLLRKLRDANQELAFERRADINQADIDSIISELTG
ncbi:MAG: cyclic nucleotide-binding domain-containing protein, partial [Spirochaetales bacterium]|nr:cyclic nucleotide-binding domain-containing protein [Spirochaetales bacterium]